MTSLVDACVWSHKGNVRRGLVWLIFFLMIVIVNWEYRYQVPIWDTAGGLFAPAEYLYHTNFDLLGLLNEDGFSLGGPNVHVFNLLTFVTALDMWLFQGDRELIYLSLHLLQFSISASIIYGVFYLALPIFGPVNAVLMSIAVFIFPPFLVQTRYMYMELTGAVFLLWSYSAWVRGHYKMACFMGICACTIKSFGLALILALIILICVDRGRSLRNRLGLVVSMLVPAAAIEALRWYQGTNMATEMITDFNVYFVNSFLSRLQKTPDLYILISIVLYGTIFWLVSEKISWQAKLFDTRRNLSIFETSQRMLVGGGVIIGAFMCFIITVPLVGVNIFPVTRYYMWIWPLVLPTVFCLVFVFYDKFRHIDNKHLPFTSKYITLTLICVTTFFMVNSSGKYYPGYRAGIGAFSVAERSREYESFNKMQRYLLQSASELDDMPVYLNLFDHYFSSSVLMGYLDEEYGHFHNIVTAFKRPADLALYPDRFALVYSNRGHGGSSMSKLITQARQLPEYRVEVINRFSLDGFSGLIYQISRNNTWKN